MCRFNRSGLLVHNVCSVWWPQLQNEKKNIAEFFNCREELSMKFGCINKQLIKLMINIYQWIANWFEWFSERARCLCYYTVHNLYCINSVLIYSESASYPVTQWRNIDDEPAVQKCHSNVAKYRICMSPAVSRRPSGCVDETLNACQFIHGLNEEGNYVKQEFLSEMWILRYMFFGIFFLLSSLALKISDT